MINWKEKGE